MVLNSSIVKKQDELSPTKLKTSAFATNPFE